MKKVKTEEELKNKITELEIEEFIKLHKHLYCVTNAGEENIYIEDIDGNRFFVKCDGINTINTALVEYFQNVLREREY